MSSAPEEASPKTPPCSSHSDNCPPRRSTRHVRRNVRNEEPQEDNLSGTNESDQDDTDRLDLLVNDAPVVIVIYDPTSEHVPLKTAQRLRVIKSIDVLTRVEETMKYMTQGKWGHLHGLAPIKHPYPGLPANKFTAEQDQKVPGLYPIQALYRTSTNSKYWMVLYEGWVKPKRFPEDQLIDGSESLKIAKSRIEFLKAMYKLNIDRAGVRKRINYNRSPDDHFLTFEDLSYYHSLIQKNEERGYVRYLNLKKEKIHAPVFTFTTHLIMAANIYRRVNANQASKSIEELRRGRPAQKTDVVGGCENERGCVCDERFALLFYKYELSNLQTSSEGLLDMRSFDNDKSRISIECSDKCGCSVNCPRRQLQRGGKKSLVVNYEGPEKQFGLRAAEDFKSGELITEYTGVLKHIDSKSDSSYQAEVTMFDKNLVIDASDFGNVGRFPSHCCQPNAALILVYSRKYENDPLIPRVGIYAITDIAMGSEICPSYYSKSDLEKARDEKKGVRCLCRSGSCYGYLPM